MTIFGPTIDTRALFPRDRRALLDLLGSLEPEDWARPTVCPGWDVHDVVGHVLNDHLRRLSGSRDGYGGAVFANDETLPTYLARTNEEAVRASRQWSPRVMIELLAQVGPRLDEVWSLRDPGSPAGLDVSWAATDLASPAWLDTAREYTEYWVHQQQVRDAVSRPGGDEPELLGPVVVTFMRALPYALRDEAREEGTAVRFDVTGPAGGHWLAVRQDGRWGLAAGDTTGEPAARVGMDQDVFWRLASRGITVEEARRRSDMRGDPALTGAATTLLAIVW